VVMLLATPVLAVTLVMLMMERGLGVGFFDPALGGDPVLFQHMFWFYSHPAVYIMILPAMGVASEVVAAFTRKKIFGYRFVAYSLRGGRRNGDGVSRRPSLLVAEDDRPHVSGVVGATCGAARLHRIQSDVLPAIRSRIPRHAAPLPRVCAGVPGAERFVDRRR